MGKDDDERLFLTCSTWPGSRMELSVIDRGGGGEEKLMDGCR